MMSPSEMERRIIALERKSPTGMGISTHFGQSEVRQMQVGFPVQLTSSYSSETGYSWTQLVLDSTVPDIDSPAVPRTGFMAFTPGNDTSLQVGAVGWLEIDPQAGGWEFIAGPQCWVSSVCLQYTSNVVTGLIVQYTCTNGAQYCVKNPTGCCAGGPVTGFCWPNPCTNGLPSTLYASFSTCTVAPSPIPLSLVGNSANGVCTWVGSFTQGGLQYTMVLSVGSDGTLNLCINQGSVSTTGLGCGSGSTYTISSCDPFCATFTGYTGALPCGGNITISADPAGCGNPITYNCDTGTGQCYEVYDGSGTYSTLAACQAACNTSPPPPCPGSGTRIITISNAPAGGIIGTDCTGLNNSWSAPWSSDTTFIGTHMVPGLGSVTFQFNCESATSGLVTLSGGATGSFPVSGTTGPPFAMNNGMGGTLGTPCVHSLGVKVKVT